MKKIQAIICMGLFLFFAFHSISFCQTTTAQEYYDHATYLYLTGDLDGALKDLGFAIKLAPSFTAAKNLTKTILREKALTSAPPPPPAPTPTPPPPPPAPSSWAQTANKIKLMAFSISEPFRANPSAVSGIIGGCAGLFILFILLSTISKRYQNNKILNQDRLDTCFICGAKLDLGVEYCPNCGTDIGLKLMRTVSEEHKKWLGKMGWKGNPFTLDIHPELFVGHRKDGKEILGKIQSKSGHILITAPMGTGKTTFLRWLAIHLGKESMALFIPRPPQDFNQLIKYIIENLYPNAPAKDDKFDIYNFNQLRRKINKDVVLLLDEAHEYSVDIERPLRTLGDLDRVILIAAGLPETIEKLKNEFQPLYDRMVLKIEFKNLTFEEMQDMIRARIKSVNGMDFRPFNVAAVEKIFELSKGNPRSTIKVCDKAVAKAIDRNLDQITPELIEEA
jgi:type II secretory pathway predicted ATPase ExeA